MYKFENHNVTISPESIEIVSVTFNLKSETTTAEIILITEKSQFGTFISSATQPTAWTTEALGQWVNETLKDYEV